MPSRCACRLSAASAGRQPTLSCRPPAAERAWRSGRVFRELPPATYRAGCGRAGACSGYARQSTPADEFGGDRLHQLRAVAVIHRARGDERVNQRRRDDQVRQPQRREQRFGEGAEVQHPATAIRALHRRYRQAVVMKLAVVIVLDDPGLLPVRQRQQRQAACQAERCAGWVLVRGRQINQTRVGQGGVSTQAVAVHRDRRQGGSGADKSVSCPGVTRLFHPDAVAAVQQQRGDQLQRLLRTGQHDNLPCIADHAARLIDVGGNRFTQRQIALRVAVAQQAFSCSRRRCAVSCFHKASGNARRSGEPAANARGCCGSRQPPVCTICWPRCERRGMPAAVAGGGDLAMIIATKVLADAALQIPLRLQLTVGRFDGHSREAQIAGQHPAGRQALPNAQCSLVDGLPQCAAQAIAQRTGGVGRLLKQRDQRVPHNGSYHGW